MSSFVSGSVNSPKNIHLSLQDLEQNDRFIHRHIGPSKYEITAKLTGNPEAVMVIDGQDEIMITIDDIIRFKESGNPVELVRFSDNFFERIRTKLRL